MKYSTKHTGILILFMSLVITGCASGSGNGNQNSDVQISQTQGLVVQQFSPRRTEVFSGQKVSLRASVKNKGGNTANHTRLKIFNVPISGSGGWSLDKTTGDQGSNTNDKLIELGTIEPPKPSTGVPSIAQRASWRLSSPQVSSGTEIPYTFKLRSFYTYETTGITKVKIMGDERFTRQGGSRTKPTVDNSGGPIQLSVRTRSPIVFFSPSGTETSQFCIIASNPGGGTTIHPSGTPLQGSSYNTNRSKIGKIKLTAKVRGASDVTFDGSQSKTKSLELVGNQPVKCFTLKVTNFDSGNIQLSVPIEITAKYGYYMDDQTQVLVKGK